MAFGAHISCADNNHLVSDEPGTNRTPGISDRGVVSYPLKTSVASKHHITPAIRYTLGRGNTNGMFMRYCGQGNHRRTVSPNRAV